MNLKKRLMNFWALIALALFLVLGGTGVAAQMGNHARGEFAGAQISGNPKGATDRALYVDQSNSSVKRVVFFAAGAQTPVSGTTPVASSTYCGFGGRTLFSASAYLIGTMTGTNPTLAITWQHSDDGGTNWTTVGTFTTVNATVTPAAQHQTVSDIWNATTAVAYGDCWRALKTYSGTTPGGNLEVVMLAK